MALLTPYAETAETGFSPLMRWRREKGDCLHHDMFLWALYLWTTHKQRKEHPQKGGCKRSVCTSLKRYLFTCWSCFYKELLIAVFLKRTFLFSLLFLSWNKWKMNILQGQNILSCLVVSVCNLSSVIMNYLYIYIYILNVNLVFYNFNYIYKDYACISFTVIIIMNTIFFK